MSISHAQIVSSIKLSKKSYLTGEDVIATVTVTNNSGRPQVFSGDERKQWLIFNLLSKSGDPITPRSRFLFQPMKIAAGQSLSRDVVLSQYFHLQKPGTYSVYAAINPTGPENLSATSNRAFFTQETASTYWSQKIGLASDPNAVREYRVLNFISDGRSIIYAQVNDADSGYSIRTFPLGEVLMTRRPSCTIDGKQSLHVLYLATPSIWVHNIVSPNGKLLARQLYQFGPQGSPQLFSFSDGSVRVGNAIPYNLKNESEQKSKSHKASDRPTTTF